MKIIESQTNQGWGTKIINLLSKDLGSEFPDIKGFSPQNLKYKRKFAQEFSLNEISQQGVEQLPWGHIVTLIYNMVSKEERYFYIKSTIQNGWSRNILSMQIETRLFERQGKAVTNFKEKLSVSQ